jgi:hypothetical protein
MTVAFWVVLAFAAVEFVAIVLAMDAAMKLAELNARAASQ